MQAGERNERGRVVGTLQQQAIDADRERRAGEVARAQRCGGAGGSGPVDVAGVWGFVWVPAVWAKVIPVAVNKTAMIAGTK